MTSELFHNTEPGVSFGIVFEPRRVAVCFWKWEWNVEW